ncbi:hypothetical protein HK098_000085 [Nowakowskiella sp. JEL0407]|nr:hypothetical protein HK098_000085 [Nowakowskiella sp. JEL0407]
MLNDTIRNIHSKKIHTVTLMLPWNLMTKSLFKRLGQFPSLKRLILRGSGRFPELLKGTDDDDLYALASPRLKENMEMLSLSSFGLGSFTFRGLSALVGTNIHSLSLKGLSGTIDLSSLAEISPRLKRFVCGFDISNGNVYPEIVGSFRAFEHLESLGAEWEATNNSRRNGPAARMTLWRIVSSVTLFPTTIQTLRISGIYEKWFEEFTISLLRVCHYELKTAVYLNGKLHE